MGDARGRLAAVAAAATVLLAGCSDEGSEGSEDTGPLAADRLPGEVVESETSTQGTPTATLCPALTRVQEDVALTRASAEDSYRSWTYRLEDSTWIAVTVVDPGVELQDWDGTRDEVRAAVEACAERENVGEIGPLDDLPDDAVGYRSTTTDSNGTTDGETVLAPAGDRIVMVVATHDAGSEPSVDVRDLLDEVRDSAADIDLG